jgi:hypothetical protein
MARASSSGVMRSDIAPLKKSSAQESGVASLKAFVSA